MNYFRKTKFRETSLIFVGIFIAIIYFTISDSPEEDDRVQVLIDAAVEEAVEEAFATNLMNIQIKQINLLQQLWHLFSSSSRQLLGTVQ